VKTLHGQAGVVTLRVLVSWNDPSMLQAYENNSDRWHTAERAWEGIAKRAARTSVAVLESKQK